MQHRKKPNQATVNLFDIASVDIICGTTCAGRRRHHFDLVVAYGCGVVTIVSRVDGCMYPSVLVVTLLSVVVPSLISNIVVLIEISYSSTVSKSSL